MKISKRHMVAGAIVLGILLGGVLWGQKHPAVKSQGHDVYYCPMHPTYTSDRPGDCPICYMKLVKRETSSDGHGDAAHPAHNICLLHNCAKAHEGGPCPMLVMAKEGEKVVCPICGTYIVDQGQWKKEKKLLYWTDPMIPGYRSDKPGKSPMGMDLVPVYEEENPAESAGSLPDGYAQVLLSSRKQQLIGMTTAAVKKQPLVKTIRTVGTVAHDPELYQAQAEYIEAVQAYERARESTIPEVVDQSRRLVESIKIRLKHLGLSDELIEETAQLKEPQHSLLFAHPGQPVWMYAKIYESELPFVKAGQAVAVEVPGLATENFHGTIRAIDPMVDSMTRTVRARVLLEDPKGELKPEMYVNVTIAVELGEVLTVPATAVFDTGTKQIVFIDRGKGIFEPRDVKLGVQTEDVAQILQGLQEGDVVVTSGNFLIDSESRLKAAVEGMTPQEGGHAHGQ